jgi:sulfite reductase (ferredoxin)
MFSAMNPDKAQFEAILNKISPIAKNEIVDLSDKINDFRLGIMDSEKFRSFRLTRGVYGQRQEGVQMVRIKLPFGKVTPDQIDRIADISDKYASKNLHLTTRQDIQIHFVNLENTPKVWAELAEKNITTREACGNTVRNVTASDTAGVDPKEPFDVTPYAYAAFSYFLRNPICQEMGRKFKISFSSSDADTAFGFMHDLGYIPKIKIVDGKEVRGFKVFLAGGLGAQPYLAHESHDFLPEDQVIPYTEAVIRVFDRYGERTKRNKARLKYLVNGIGLETFNDLVAKERIAIKTKSYEIDRNAVPEAEPSAANVHVTDQPSDQTKFNNWVTTNVFEQKQKGFFGVYIKQHLGDMETNTARLFSAIVRKFAADDIRITVNQGWLLKYVTESNLPALFNELNQIGLAEPGFDSLTDITACPGTDTCNLGISSSTGLSAELERMILEEYPDMIFEKNIKIKISGCMNACGQHSIANIGFHGMSIKNGAQVLPAMQLMLGGGLDADGVGTLADKTMKLPSKRCLEAVRYLLNDYEANCNEDEYFNNYYRRQIATEKMYFYKMLKPLGDLSTTEASDYIDFGHDEQYITAVGVGECAGVMLDLVATLLNDTEDKLIWAKKAFDKQLFADAIYHCYSTFVTGAKAMLTIEGINCNTQIGIINDFEEHMIQKGLITLGDCSFADTVLEINKNEPTPAFAKQYLDTATNFLANITAYRNNQVQNEKTLINN